MRKPTSINLKWLIQEHANAKAVWKHINHVLQNRSLVPLGSPPHSKPSVHREREHSLKQKCWYQWRIQAGFWIGTQLPGWQKPSKEEHLQLVVGSGLEMRSWPGGSVLSRGFMHKKLETNPTQRECRGAPCTKKGSVTHPCSVQRILNKTLSYPWHFSQHLRVWKCF